MQILLYISDMELGDEVPVRRAHERFPLEALQRGIGVDRLAAFIGSGYYALEITVSDGDVQTNFHRFLAAPEVQAFFAGLRPYVRTLPAADAQTADLPLAAAMLLWQSQASPDSTPI